MTNFRIPSPQQNSLNDFIAEAFNATTIVLVGVLGILTVAATF